VVKPGLHAGTIFSLTWDRPGIREGIGLQRIPMLGSDVGMDGDVADWDVGARAFSWKHMVGTRVTGVDLHYRPWDDEQGSLGARTSPSALTVAMLRS
jgi:hypothetical protein